MMTRRKLLQGAIAAGVWHMLGKTGRAGQASSAKDIENLQNNWRALLAKDFKAPAPSDPLKLSNDEWRKRLDAAQFQTAHRNRVSRARSAVAGETEGDFRASTDRLGQSMADAA